MDIKKLGWDPLTLGEIDHRLVCAPYVRLSAFLEGPAGDVIFVFDLRATQPGKVYLSTPVLHSFEHLLLAGFRKYLPDHFVSIAPMGCQTGFYLVLQNEGRFEEVCRAYRAILDDIVTTQNVPYATPDKCGQPDHHNLTGSKKLAQTLIAAQQDWRQIF